MKFKRVLNMIQNVKNWHVYLYKKMTGTISNSFTFTLRNNYSVEVPKQIIPEFKESFFNEVYFKYLPKKIYQLQNPTVIDIGANVGFLSILALYKLNNPRILAFEPILRNFELLKKNTSSLNSENLTIINKAVSNINGELKLQFDNSQNITTSASLFNNTPNQYEEVVQSTTLEYIFNDYNLKKIDILKLDCEGAEYDILYKTPVHLFEKINCISLESHQGKASNENNQSLVNYIAQLGYSVITKENNLIWAYKNLDRWN